MAKIMTRKKTVYTALLLCIIGYQHITAKQPIIMIDPAGHAKDTGRKLSQSYERAETYACAEALKTALEARYNTQVVLSRTPGKEIVPLQHASFANRFNVDLFIRLQFYKKNTEKPKIYIHHLVYDPLIDFIQRTPGQYTFIPVQQAHFQNIEFTENIAKTIQSHLSQTHHQKLFDCHTIMGLPIKPLIGIIAPAIMFDIGIHDDQQWQLLIDPIVESLASVITKS